MAKFNDVKDCIKLTVLAGRVPALVGMHGLGKSQMMKEVANDMGLDLITVESGLLKEGEIGGLPIVVKKEMNGITINVTEYAAHNKIRKMYELLEANKDNEEYGILLFIDEFNRSENAVMQECMNIILNREINGIEIPENVFIVCAMNPTAGMDGYDRASGNNCNYTTKELDPAQADRLCFINVDSDADTWLDWASNSYGAYDDNLDKDQDKDYIMLDKTQFKTNIHQDIIEYISTEKDALSRQTDNATITASPRSWEMVSDIMRTFELNKGLFKDNILANCIKGLIGDAGYIKFQNFLANNKNPLIKGEEFFKGKTMDEKLFEKYEDETQQRQYLIAKSALLFLSDKSRVTEEDKKRYVKVIKVLPGDMTLSLMRYTRNNYPQLHEKLRAEKEYFTNLLELNARLSK